MAVCCHVRLATNSTQSSSVKNPLLDAFILSSACTLGLLVSVTPRYTMLSFPANLSTNLSTLGIENDLPNVMHTDLDGLNLRPWLVM